MTEFCLSISRQPAHAAYGAHLAHLRCNVGLTQSALARAVGVRPNAICHIEAGRVLPRLERLQVLAAALRVDVEEVVP